jgi:hypothetical protein
MSGFSIRALAGGVAALAAAIAAVSCGGSNASSDKIAGLQRAPEVRGKNLCGARPGSPELVERLDQELSTLSPTRAGGTVVIPLYVHVITDGNTGNISNALITRQIDVLNRAFDGRTSGLRTRYTFRHMSTDRTSNASWYTANLGTPEERDMKTALHRGNAGSFNLYINLGNPDEQSGWSSFPWEYRADPKMDGVVLWNGSLPGNTTPGFELGTTAIHEAGHWMGLFHTFEGGCAAPGDGIGDTPSEQPGVDGCPLRRDTCPSPGADPINNFMDYSADSCKSRFSPGQIGKMNMFWDKYRAQ